MLYQACIESSPKGCGVVVPDLPGCFAAGDTLEEAMAMAEEAIVAWIETAIDAGQDIPQPSSIDALRKAHKEWKGWAWAVVKVDPAALDETSERVNISLPRRVLRRLDALATARAKPAQASLHAWPWKATKPPPAGPRAPLRLVTA
jgi:predicted RNase H-like HicB family nuclease